MIQLIPWAGDYPILRIEVANMTFFIKAPKRKFWIYYNVQTIPSQRYDDLKEVATAAKWSFVIDTGVEQLKCSNTVSYDVLKTLDYAMLSYQHRDRVHMTWDIPISTKNAQQLSTDIKKEFAGFKSKYLVKHKSNIVFQPFGFVVKYSGDMYKYHFSFSK